MTKEPQKFETAIKRLEEIVESLDSKDIELDNALKLFEEGVSLVRFCSNKLDETKKKIEILTKKDGKIVAESFDEKQM